MKRLLLNLTVLIGFLLAGCAKDPSGAMREILLSDNILTKNVVANISTISTPQEKILFYKDNYQARAQLITALKNIQASEQTALEKNKILRFLEMENSFCESEATYLAMDYEMRARSRNFSGFIPLDPNVEREARKRNAIQRSLFNSEPSLINYGWSYAWDKEKSKKVDQGEQKKEKPIFLDASQWRYVEENSLRKLKDTDKYYIWVKEISSQDGTRSAIVGYKDRNKDVVGTWLFVSKRQYFCADKRLIKQDSMKIAGGYTASNSEGDSPEPIDIGQSVVSTVVYAELCEGRSFFEKLKFWKS